MKTADQIKTLVRLGETAEVEFKRARGGVTPDFWESYSAFANTDGGAIVLGVREVDGGHKVEGLQDAERTIADLWNAANNPDRVSVNVLTNRMVYPVDVDGRMVVVVEVPRADRTDKPVYVGSDVFRGTFRRNGEGDYHCTREAINAMIRDQGVETADNCVLEELSLSDLNTDSIRRYRMLFANLRTDHIWCALPDDEFMVKIGAAKRERDHAIHPNLAGLVCFGDFNVISDILPNFFLDYREHYSQEVRWTDRICSGDATWSGNVLDFYFKVCQPITAGVKTPFKIAADNVTRDDDTPVHKSLREVLANALIHADYHGRQGVVIEKYLDRLVVSNPGTFRIGKQVAIAGGTSDARNARIFNIFSLVKIGERSGLGIAQLHGVWQKEGFESPVITESYEPERTRLEIRYEPDGHLGKVHIEAEKQSIDIRKQSIEGEEQSIDIRKQSIEGVLYGFGLTLPTKGHILRLYGALKENEVFGRSRVMELTGLTNKPAGDLLKKLLNLGLVLTVEGQGKGKYRFREEFSACNR